MISEFWELVVETWEQGIRGVGVDDILICDDDYDGVVTGFNLELRSGELRSGNETTDPNDIDNQSPDNFPITYHLSLDDANDLNSSGITSPYESGNATIYIEYKK